jgi:hypothetical protein
MEECFTGVWLLLRDNIYKRSCLIEYAAGQLGRFGRSLSLISFTHNPDGSMQKRNSRPEKIIMVGPCRVSVFRNKTRLKDGKEVDIPKVVLEVRYKDKQGRWKGTHSLSLHEIPKAIVALETAFEWLTTKTVGGKAKAEGWSEQKRKAFGESERGKQGSLTL